MVEFKIGDIKKYLARMSSEQTIEYVKFLNESSVKVHNGLGTLCSPSRIRKITQDYGDFILGIIPHEVLPYHPNGSRKEKVEELFKKPVDISLIPPILVSGYDPNEKRREYRLDLMDGQTRSGVAYERNVPLLGYVPKKLTKKVPGFKQV